jgi:hypothetical protein
LLVLGLDCGQVGGGEALTIEELTPFQERDINGRCHRRVPP